MSRSSTVIGYVQRDKIPTRALVVFWVPQPEPWAPREVGTTEELIKALVTLIRTEQPGNDGVAPELLVDASLEATAVILQVDSKPSAPPRAGYTLVADATEEELQSLRGGTVVEHAQHYVFHREPTAEELATLLAEHEAHLAQEAAVMNKSTKATIVAESKAAPRGN